LAKTTAQTCLTAKLESCQGFQFRRFWQLWQFWQSELLNSWRFWFPHSVGTGIGARAIHARLGILHKSLPPTHLRCVLLANGQIVALVAQRLQDVRLHARLNYDLAAHMVSGNRESRRFQRSLKIHAVVHEVRNKLRVSQRLVRASHDAKADMNVAALHERRNDRVEWPLARLQCIGMVAVENKQRSAILQWKSHSIHHDS